jgi:hypothetical protein
VLFDVALEMNLSAFREQTFAAFLAPAANDGASVLGAHPLPKSELLFPGAFGGLKSTFRHVLKWGKFRRFSLSAFAAGEKRVGKVGASRFLSTALPPGLQDSSTEGGNSAFSWRLVSC